MAKGEKKLNSREKMIVNIGRAIGLFYLIGGGIYTMYNLYNLYTFKTNPNNNDKSPYNKEDLEILKMAGRSINAERQLRNDPEFEKFFKRLNVLEEKFKEKHPKDIYAPIGQEVQLKLQLEQAVRLKTTIGLHK